MSETVLELVEISKIFNEHSSNKLTIFQNMNLKIKNSELVGIIAPSGTGKTSLLNISGLLDLPSHGEVKIIDNNTRALSTEMRNDIRRKHIGFVFQSGNLINEFNAIENEYGAMNPAMREGLVHICKSFLHCELNAD